MTLNRRLLYDVYYKSSPNRQSTSVFSSDKSLSETMASKNPHIRDGDNPDITEERLKATFNVDKFTEFYHFGEKRVQVR